jgi:NAD(P) transhydrogenase
MPDETKTYDLIVIGGGPAGIIGAATAKATHKTVALLDNHRELGGAGVNTGTVPSKTLRETALALSGIKARKLTGVDLSLKHEATVADFLRHEQHVKAGFNATISQQLRADKADVYFGTGSFVDSHTVRVRLGQTRQNWAPLLAAGGEVLLHGESFLIATGSSPLRPALFPFNSPEIYDSDTILALDFLPERLAVVGAGVIGSEYACTFAVLETHVDLIDGRDVLLPFLDGEVSRALAAAMRRNGVVFHLKENVQECRGRGAAGIRLRLSSGATLTVDAVLVAAGRQSNTEKLDLPAAGVAVGERGVIPVDDQFRTNVPHIYAAGDVIGFPALASTSMEQARRAVRHALGLESRVGISHLLPNGIYTIPEVSMVGETEESLQKQRVDYVVGRANYQNNARGRIIGDLDGFLKLLFRRGDMKLLGVHIMGEQATEIVHVGLMAMLAGCTADVFTEACFNAPTLGALYKSATIDASLTASGSAASLTALAEA